ncbi:transcriptional regulator GcvA [Herbaspirillum sp. HC18]|nr:transcriptional regulator GcvA [Herbaspirillum sp. HC18]
MHGSMPPLSALRAFEAAARHLSFTKAAAELNVTPGALSHQIRGLEEFLGVQLFERRTRSIALTTQGTLLYPGLQAGFGLIRDAVAGLRVVPHDNVLVISTPPGLTSKWLASRLYRFADACPDVDVRVSSSQAAANFSTDGVDAAIRSLPLDHAEDFALSYEKVIDVMLAPVCSPKLIAKFGPLDAPGTLARVPIIHDDSLAGKPGIPTFEDWLKASGLEGGDVERGLRFSSADHALDAALEGAGLLLTHTILAHDDLRSGRLVMPFDIMLPLPRAYYFVCPKARLKQRSVKAFKDWLHIEADRLDERLIGTANGGDQSASERR